MSATIPQPGHTYRFREEKSQKYLQGGFDEADASIDHLILGAEDRRKNQSTMRFEVYEAASPSGDGFFVRTSNRKFWRYNPVSNLVDVVEIDPRKTTNGCGVGLGDDLNNYIFTFTQIDATDMVLIGNGPRTLHQAPADRPNVFMLVDTPMIAPFQLQFEVIDMGNRILHSIMWTLLIILFVVVGLVLIYLVFTWLRRRYAAEVDLAIDDEPPAAVVVRTAGSSVSPSLSEDDGAEFMF